MRPMFWFAVASAVATGSMALAQVAVTGVTASVSNTAPDMLAATAAVVNTNKPDLAKRNGMYGELAALNKEMRVQEAKLMAEDPELMALAEKRSAAQITVMEIEKQRRTMVEAKLAADPKFGPLLARHRELLQSMPAMPPHPGGVAPRGSPVKLPMEHALKAHPAPAPAPSAPLATVPAVEKPDGQLKTE